MDPLLIIFINIIEKELRSNQWVDLHPFYSLLQNLH